MRKGVLEYCILSIISNEGRCYASQILERLKEAQLLVVEGTLYPLLMRLKNDGYLSYEWEESRSGPPRKYYQLTAAGKGFLEELRRSWNELVQAVQTAADGNAEIQNPESSNA